MSIAVSESSSGVNHHHHHHHLLGVEGSAATAARIVNSATAMSTTTTASPMFKVKKEEPEDLDAKAFNLSGNNNRAPEGTNEAIMLLSLRSAPASPNSMHHGHMGAMSWTKENGDCKVSPIARFETRGLEYLMRGKRAIVGRDSSRGKVDVNMGRSTFVSRRHVEINYEQGKGFFMTCKGKNGVFVDGAFQRRGSPPYRLEQACTFRFPSTNIRLEFRSLIEDKFEEMDDGSKSPMSDTKRMNGQLINIFNPLNVNITDGILANNVDMISPAPSPTGTISAANSCPASPRANFGLYPRNRGGQQDFQRMVTAAMSKDEAIKYEFNEQSQLQQQQQPKKKKSTANQKSFQQQQQQQQPSLSQSQLLAQQGGMPMLANLGNSPSTQGIIIASGAGQGNLIKTPNGTLIQNNEVYGTPQQQHSAGSGANTPQANYSNASDGNDEDGKPPYSYAQLIVQAIASAHDKQLTLSGIYTYITKHYPYYRTAEKGWQNSIRHNLSLNRYFLKVARSQSEPGKGSFWRIDPASEAKLIEQSSKRRRQRAANNSCGMSGDGSHAGGRSGGNISSRSAPVSPQSMGGFASGLATPEEMSREPSPSPSQENIESEIITSGGYPLMGSSIYLGYPGDSFPSNRIYSKSAPGSPGHSSGIGLVEHPNIVEISVANVEPQPNSIITTAQQGEQASPALPMAFINNQRVFLAPHTSGTFSGTGSNVYTITQMPGGLTSQPTILHHHQLTGQQPPATTLPAVSENAPSISSSNSNNNNTANAAATAAAIALTNLHNTNTNQTTGVTQTATNTAPTGVLTTDGNKTVLTNSALPQQPQPQTVIIHTPVGATTAAAAAAAAAAMDDNKAKVAPPPPQQQQQQQLPQAATHLVLPNGKLVALSSEIDIRDMAQAMSSLGNPNGGNNIIISLPSASVAAQAAAAATSAGTITSATIGATTSAEIGAVTAAAPTPPSTTANINTSRPIDLLTNAAIKVVTEAPLITTPIVSIVTSNVTNNNVAAAAATAEVCVATDGSGAFVESLKRRQEQQEQPESNETKKLKIEQ